MRILLVEDDYDIAFVFSSVLQGEGHSVLWADTGESLLEQLKLHEFDLLITDNFVPDMEVRNLLPELKKTYPDMPIILCSGAPGLKSKADLFMQKPFSIESFLGALALFSLHSA